VRQSTGFLGLVGIILLAFAGAAFFLAGFTGPFDRLYILAHAVVGVLALAAYLSSGLENLRTFLGERSTKFGTSALVASLFFIGILASLNYISLRHHHRFDLTEAGVFSLSPQSVQVVKALDKDLHIQAFVEGGSDPELRDLLDSYRYASPKVSFELLDPDRQPDLAERYGISAYNTVRLEYGNNSTTVTQPNEETITNAIIKVTRASQQTVCFVEGHGEPDIDDTEDAHSFSQAKLALTNENYAVKKVLLASMEKVPDDCSLLVVAGPQRPYLDHELAEIEQRLKDAKPVLFLLPPQRAAQFVDLLAKWGVKVGNDVVVDKLVRLFEGPALGLAPLVETYDPSHEITREFKQRTIFPMTRSVETEADDKPGLTVTELVKTSPSSWAETDLNGLFDRHEATLDENDQKGPVPIAVAVEANLKEMGLAATGKTRLAVFGSVEFADNRNIDTFFNRDLLMNTVGWLVGESDLVSIRPKALRASRVLFSRDEGTIIFYLSVLILPELLLIAGLAVWWRRE
jgi:ABC-type uncharacterized transport system involved in gliding motility auxiliary subunit